MPTGQGSNPGHLRMKAARGPVGPPGSTQSNEKPSRILDVLKQLFGCTKRVRSEAKISVQKWTKTPNLQTEIVILNSTNQRFLKRSIRPR
ncbi:hypothetical protein L596_012288 [Steinernema carpocapsae]|uniref:Uncharacterized protein n=1 Tax=Steinernema carpocapsae TaxID=34508 RepID=A0A4U5NWZ5_STECR|nr:hypothetical protein L596_012288 [Steinernema carpocapsae]